MDYALPKDLAYKHNLSQKTVYNYLAKYPDNIRTKKEFGKKYIHIEDFTKVFQKVYNMHSKPLQNSQENGPVKVGNDSEGTLDDKDYLISKNEDLKKRNSTLEDQIVKYAILLKEEKVEKNLFLGKYEQLQAEHINKIEEFSKEKILYNKRFSLLLIVTCVMGVISIIVALLYFLGAEIIVK